MKGFDLMKALIVILFTANVGFLCYNALTMIDRLTIDEDVAGIAGAQQEVVRIKSRIERYKADIERIKRQRIIRVESASEYFQNQAAKVRLRHPVDIDIPLSPDTQTGRKFDEDSWKISFQSRQKQFSLKDVAQFADLIESESPGFQIREVDLGSRDEAWGSDLWKVSNVTVRRLTPKKKSR